MKNIIILLLTLLLIAGCASTVTSPTVEGNIFISHSVPKLMIEVSDKFPFQYGGQHNYSGTDTHGASATVGVKAERYIFRNHISESGLVIMIEKFSGTGGRWEMEAPDYSSFPGIIVSGSTEMNGKQYLTGIYWKSKTYGRFIYKSYGRICGAGNDVRFEIIFFERLSITVPTSAFVESFSLRADKSFTIQPYTEVKIKKLSQNEEDNSYIKQNAEKTEGSSCLDSLGCAKGYFCINNKCKKGFAD